MSQKLKCSFCGKSEDDILFLLAGPEIYICDSCVDLCNEIILERKRELQEEYEATHWIFKL